MGYHINQIQKGIINQFSKIEEEIQELQDAHSQQNPILELVEISDLLGAIEAYTYFNYNLKLEDLIKMTRSTQSAFISGERK